MIQRKVFFGNIEVEVEVKIKIEVEVEVESRKLSGEVESFDTPKAATQNDSQEIEVFSTCFLLLNLGLKELAELKDL